MTLLPIEVYEAERRAVRPLDPSDDSPPMRPRDVVAMVMIGACSAVLVVWGIVTMFNAL